jgi:selenocysteine-specific elongation factor
MFVLATAGHVDHGKSTLVRALTGMEPDRWAEEHRRGMTIDLGYAWTTLPTGASLAFVDVPGHERFIANMLAGLGPAPGVLFVVAADEGWSRQSDEHLAAISALDLRHGVLAVTRSDLADPTATTHDSLARIRHSSLGVVDAVAVSGTTGLGLAELRAELARLVVALPAPDLDAPVRLWVDRSFTVRGSGTVVTGTLAAGSIAVGATLMLDDRKVVVRAMQSLSTSHPHIEAVARVALNLRGVAADEISRGDVLLTPRRWHLTDVVDVRVPGAAALPAALMLHIGTAALTVRLRPLGTDTARITLSRTLPLRAGDRGVLRDPSRHAVAGGLLVLDADPPQFHRRGAAHRRAIELQTATGRPEPAIEIGRRGAVRADHLAALGIPRGGARQVGEWVISDDTWQRWVSDTPEYVVRWAARDPLQPRMPLPALARALDVPDDALLDAVLTETDLVVADGRVGQAAPASLGPAESAIRAIEQRLRDAPFDPPDRNDLAALGLGNRELAAAERAGRLVRISGDIVLLPDAPDLAVKTLRTLGQPFTTSQARAALGTTRRVCVPLLEHLDVLERTVRVDAQLRRLR